MNTGAADLAVDFTEHAILVEQTWAVFGRQAIEKQRFVLHLAMRCA